MSVEIDYPLPGGSAPPGNPLPVGGTYDTSNVKRGVAVVTVTLYQSNGTTTIPGSSANTGNMTAASGPWFVSLPMPTTAQTGCVIKAVLTVDGANPTEDQVDDLDVNAGGPSISMTIIP